MSAQQLRARRAAIALVLAALPFWAAPSCSLPAVHGRVLDRETRAPIAEVRVVEQRRSAQALSDVSATLHARVARTDASGRFSFPSETPASAGVALRGGRAPIYVLAHPRYGLIRSDEKTPGDAELVFEMSLQDVTARQSLASLCESRPREDWERELAAEICPRR
jgi:hypothetical protein